MARTVSDIRSMLSEMASMTLEQIAERILDDGDKADRLEAELMEISTEIGDLRRQIAAQAKCAA